VTIKRVYTGRNITMYYQDSLRDFAEIAMSPKIQAACVAECEAAKPYAIAISPRDSGLYAASWHAYPAQDVVFGMRRVTGRLINRAPYSATVEFGGKPGGGRFRGRYRKPQHIVDEVRKNMRRAARA
jgi:hypothetical protein